LIPGRELLLLLCRKRLWWLLNQGFQLRLFANKKGFQSLGKVRVGWGADEVPQSAALFRPPSPKPIVQLSLQWAFQHHLLHEADIGFRLIGLPYVTSWWQVVQSTSVLRFLAAIILTHAGFSRPS
jgi:hypothetical protein